MSSTLTLAPHEVGARVILRPVEPQPGDRRKPHLIQMIPRCLYGQPGDVVTVLTEFSPEHDDGGQVTRESQRTIASVRVARLGDVLDNAWAWNNRPEAGICPWPDGCVWVIELES